MIPVAEVRALRAEWQLRDDIIEKDFALGWILAAIAADPTSRPPAASSAEPSRGRWNW
ncbi:MAG: hypothetical protein HYU54_10705 [Actinobacteria bacterium]|nr:hypothetical protein [Actinomycetota bacterium]